MKKSELKQLIKEEIIKEISEIDKKEFDKTYGGLGITHPSDLPSVYKTHVVDLTKKLDKTTKLVNEIKRTINQLSEIYRALATEFNNNPKYKLMSNDKMVLYMKSLGNEINKLKRFLKEIDK
jgi:uncharacterized phage infection (PIP) family protein YhgE